MNSKKGKVRIASLLVVLALGVTVAWAYFTATDSADNIFRLGNRYTLTYHANAGSDDSKVINVPEKQTKFGDGVNPVTFDVSTQLPVRPGFVFKGWYEKETPASDDTKYGDGGQRN